MKTIKILTTVFLVLVSTLIFSQSKDDNSIVFFKFDKSNLKVIEDVLINNFYEIKSIDTIRYRFRTEHKPVEGSIYANGLTVSIIGYIENNNLIMYSTYSSSFNNTNYTGFGSFIKNRPNVSKSLTYAELLSIGLDIQKKINSEFIHKKIDL